MNAHYIGMMRFQVLGPILAHDDRGTPVALRGPRHREVLARLILAHRRVVPVGRLVEDLWDEPPPNAVGAVRTFVAGLRRALEPDRAPRTPPRLLVTEGLGYALRPDQADVDAWRFDDAVRSAASLPPEQAFSLLTEALSWWQGPAYTDVADAGWARAERARLTEQRLLAVERRATAQLALGAAAAAVPGLDAHVAEHPWREDAWGLLATALYRSGRQADALAVLARARRMLAEDLGIDPGPALRRLEHDLLRQAEYLDPDATDPTVRVWEQARAAYDSAVAPRTRTRLESTAGLMRDLAVTGGGGLTAARAHRISAVIAADDLGDAELTARVIGIYDVPAIWTRSDDPVQDRRLVEIAERTLLRLPTHDDADRARLLATIAVESRGALPVHTVTEAGLRPLRAAGAAEEIARRLHDPALLAFALNGVFMQSFRRAGLAPRREAVATEILTVATNAKLATYQVLGHLILIQTCCARADYPGADQHADVADALARRYELPLVEVFTTWYRAMRTAATPDLAAARAAYTAAADVLTGAGMPGLDGGLLPLAQLSLALREHETATIAAFDPETDWGPYRSWVEPTLLVARDELDGAREALRTITSPPRDLLFEALWAIVAHAAVAVGDRETMRRARTQLAPAAAETTAQSGLLSIGPVRAHLDDLDAALLRSPVR
ncbi:AfsR/SARP family transcriptional regulator [Nocardia alba]|uniref:DNA-binding SARP family transcriptional activator n=1 Tax=Nocardia alba TaxID=225051 RepID=A0A4R1FFS9_9NOCA|nr:AfsR/SARP family transcriptional regulator [Nocardia alba]TCJ89711.1 DNA-binding SARP family transcriptional activator [Nocardia alba]